MGMFPRERRVYESGLLSPRQRAVQALMSSGGNVYVYGPPGTGKTTLLNAAHLGRPGSARWHCAEFFRAIHDELPRHGRSVELTVKALTGQAGAVFFDEFHIHDIADAIYLHRALSWWDSHGVRVVATSNYVPEQLMPNPVLHHAAEPVISLLRSHFEVAELDEGVDYRAAAASRSAGFDSGGWMSWAHHGPATASISLNARSLPVIPGPADSQVVETTFHDLCEKPWSVSDYLTLLAESTTLVVHDVPHPARIGREPGQRLANLIDVAYDQDVPVTIHSPGAPEDLHSSAFPPLDVARTVSRLRSLGAAHF